MNGKMNQMSKSQSSSRTNEWLLTNNLVFNSLHNFLGCEAVFEKNKKNQTFYKTPYGQMLIGVNTRHLQVDFEEDKIAVQIDYELDVNHEPMADCKIRMNIVSKDSGKFSVLS